MQRVIVAVLAALALAGASVWSAYMQWAPEKLQQRYSDVVRGIEALTNQQVVAVEPAEQDEQGQWLNFVLADGMVLPVCCQPRAPSNSALGLVAVRAQRCSEKRPWPQWLQDKVAQGIASGELVLQPVFLINGMVQSFYLPLPPNQEEAHHG